MNTRFLLYCKAHGKTSKQMLTHDSEQYPGGQMCGFILWSSSKLRQHFAKHPENRLNGTIANHAFYDAWLNENYL